jgi:acyl-CoA hydrolase
MIIMRQLVMPGDMNPHNTLFGGKLMAEMDKAAAIYVMQLSHLTAVTLKVSEILFQVPIRQKDIYTISCETERVGTTSVTVKVNVTRLPFDFQETHPEEWLPEEQQAATASFIMVTVDRQGNPTPHGIPTV